MTLICQTLRRVLVTSSGMGYAIHWGAWWDSSRVSTGRWHVCPMLACAKGHCATETLQGPKASTIRSFEGKTVWCRMPQALTYHLFAELTTQADLVASLSDWASSWLLNISCFQKLFALEGEHVWCVPPFGSPRLLRCCLCENWCRVGCSYQSSSRKSVSVSHKNLGS